MMTKSEETVYIKSEWAGPPYGRYKVYTLRDGIDGHLFTVDDYDKARSICDRLNEQQEADMTTQTKHPKPTFAPHPTYACRECQKQTTAQVVAEMLEAEWQQLMREWDAAHPDYDETEPFYPKWARGSYRPY